MKRLLAVVGICMLSLAGSAVLFYGLLVAVSLEKEPLSPDAAAFMRPEPSAPDPGRNGFHYWIGLDAPSGEEPEAFGRRMVRAMADRRPLEDGGRLRLAHDRKMLCHAENRTPCLELVRGKAEQIRSLAGQNAELVKRFETLLSFERFDTRLPVAGPMDPIPAPAEVVNLFTLARTLDAAQVVGGDTSGVYERMGRRVRFLRIAYGNSSDLISRVIAAVILVREMDFLAELAAAHPAAARAAMPIVDAMTAPSTTAERSSLRWLRAEFAAKYAWLDADDAAAWRFSVCGAVIGQAAQQDLLMVGRLEDRCGRWDVRTIATLAGPISDRNAILNQWHESLRQLREIDAADTQSFLVRFGEIVAAAEARRPENTRWRWRNPWGRGLAPSLSDDLVVHAKQYVLLAADMDRLFALARLAVALSAAEPSAEGIAASVKESGIRDPATGRPFEWDAKARQVYCVPADPWIAMRGRVGGIEGRVGLPAGMSP